MHVDFTGVGNALIGVNRICSGKCDEDLLTLILALSWAARLISRKRLFQSQI